MIRTFITLGLALAIALPVAAFAADLGNDRDWFGRIIVRGTVTDQGDCTNINGKLMAAYTSSTSGGIPFIFDNASTRVMPRWVAPADGQTVFLMLGNKVTCTKSNGTSREERVATYYSVSGAVRAAQTIQQAAGTTQSGRGQGAGTIGAQARAQIERLYPANNRPGVISPYRVRTIPTGSSRRIGGSTFMNQNFGGVNQQIIEDSADVSGSELIRGQAQ